MRGSFVKQLRLGLGKGRTLWTTRRVPVVVASGCVPMQNALNINHLRATIELDAYIIYHMSTPENSHGPCGFGTRSPAVFLYKPVVSRVHVSFPRYIYIYNISYIESSVHYAPSAIVSHSHFSSIFLLALTFACHCFMCHTALFRLGRSRAWRSFCLEPCGLDAAAGLSFAPSCAMNITNEL